MGYIGDLEGWFENVTNIRCCVLTKETKIGTNVSKCEILKVAKLERLIGNN